MTLQNCRGGAGGEDVNKTVPEMGWLAYMKQQTSSSWESRGMRGEGEGGGGGMGRGGGEEGGGGGRGGRRLAEREEAADISWEEGGGLAGLLQ